MGALPKKAKWAKWAGFKPEMSEYLADLSLGRDGRTANLDLGYWKIYPGEIIRFGPHRAATKKTAMSPYS